MARSRGLRFWLGAVLVGLVAASVAALMIWRDDIFEALLDPKIPYSVYRPPPAPNYAANASWAHLPRPLVADGRSIDVFFVHPTTFDGGKDWNGPISDERSARLLTEVMLPNYAAPFAGVGRVFAPRYRQASLYTSLSLFDDALEARRFAYADVLAAFRYFVLHLNSGRPFIVVGVEQGGVLADRLLRDEIETNANLRSRLVAAYLIEAATPADSHTPAAPLPACASPTQTGCVLAWISAGERDFERPLRIKRRTVVWDAKGRLVGLAGRTILCVNPLLGMVGDAEAPARLNLGSANATGLEWGLQPGFLARQVGARCVDGILRVSAARSQTLRPSGDWATRLRARDYNLFYANIEHDAEIRSTAFLRSHAAATSP